MKCILLKCMSKKRFGVYKMNMYSIECDIYIKMCLFKVCAVLYIMNYLSGQLNTKTEFKNVCCKV